MQAEACEMKKSLWDQGQNLCHWADYIVERTECMLPLKHKFTF